MFYRNFSVSSLRTFGINLFGFWQLSDVLKKLFPYAPISPSWKRLNVQSFNWNTHGTKKKKLCWNKISKLFGQRGFFMWNIWMIVHFTKLFGFFESKVLYQNPVERGVSSQHSWHIFVQNTFIEILLKLFRHGLEHFSKFCKLTYIWSQKPFCKNVFNLVLQIIVNCFPYFTIFWAFFSVGFFSVEKLFSNIRFMLFCFAEFFTFLPSFPYSFTSQKFYWFYLYGGIKKSFRGISRRKKIRPTWLFLLAKVWF